MSILVIWAQASDRRGLFTKFLFCCPFWSMEILKIPLLKTWFLSLLVVVYICVIPLTPLHLECGIQGVEDDLSMNTHLFIPSCKVTFLTLWAERKPTGLQSWMQYDDLPFEVTKVLFCTIALHLEKFLNVHRSVNQTYTVAATWNRDLFSLGNFSCTGHSWLCFVTMPAVSCCMCTLKWQLPHCVSLLWNAFVNANEHTFGTLFMSTEISCTWCTESGTQVPQVRMRVCLSPVTPMLWGPLTCNMQKGRIHERSN